MNGPTLGRNHPLLRRVRALRRERAMREAEGVFLAEGPHLLDEALRSSAGIERVLHSPRLAASSEGRGLLERARAAGCEIDEVADTLLDGLQDSQAPQPVLCVVRRPRPALATLLGPHDRRLVVVAHGLQDPGNLGSILRTADAAGADAFIATGGGADLYHPRTVRATAGSIFRLPALELDVLPLLDAIAHAGLTTWAAVPRGGEAHTAAGYGAQVCLFVGGEGAGLPEPLVERLDHRVHVPMRDGVESLSVGAAAAVLLFELARRRAA